MWFQEPIMAAQAVLQWTMPLFAMELQMVPKAVYGINLPVPEIISLHRYVQELLMIRKYAFIPGPVRPWFV